MTSDNKMKGLLKGLKILSQIFDEKEPEIEIGNPTDVKHVAHIGLDGPTENNPSWMNGFKSTSGLSSSGPLNTNGDNHSNELDDWASCDSMERSSKSLNDPEDTHDLPLTKSSKQQSHSEDMRESHAKEKSDKPRQPKRHSKNSTPNDSFNESKHTTTGKPIPKDTDSLQPQGNTNDNLPPRAQPDNPKTTHSKKTKDGQGVGGSSKSRSKAKDSNSKEGTHSRSGSKSKETNSNEGTHSRSGSKSKESKSKDSNSNEGTHSRHSSKSKDSNLNDGHSRTSSKSKDSDSKEGHRSRSSSKSKDPNSNEGDLSRPNSKPRNKHRLSEEGGQLKRESNENIMTNYPN